MSARTIGSELVAALKRLRLGGLLPTLAERFTLAEKEDTPYEDLLLLLLVDEISRRDSNASTRRAEQAGTSPDRAHRDRDPALPDDRFHPGGSHSFVDRP